ncbi:uncharacterized protein NPIL_443131 [Nephila pilipes]|uniref:Uncharacterized protein n=1 Tax=Nephila pilipes TaxID=299642 RepID=A0A8X6TJV8_NEPPI|nr:uncharacterized protein NPIL_443131 [Nephila pilipes]
MTGLQVKTLEKITFYILSSKIIKKEAGMDMRKWISNDTSLLSQWAVEDFDTYPVAKKNTKRLLFQAIEKIFHPFGLLSPFAVRIKCLMQELGVNKITWDDDLPPKIVKRWVNCYKGQRLLNNLES